MAQPLQPIAPEVAENLAGTTMPPALEPSTDQPLFQAGPAGVEALDKWVAVQSETGLTNLVPPLVPPPTPVPVVLPEQVGRFRILGMIARGGMGMILRAFDPVLGRELALKVLRLREADAEQQRRFVEEAQISARLQHPGIAPLHELARDETGKPFFVMKLIEGRTFAQLLAERASPAADLPRCLHIFEQVCQTLAYAHSKGVLHRDLKPHNIMVGPFGEVQVMDWGLAKAAEWREDEAAALRDAETVKENSLSNTPTPPHHLTTPSPLPASPSPSSHLTQEGTVIGTLSYMAPEQARGEISNLTARADVFGLGAILCEILTGDPPFRGRHWISLLGRVQRGELQEAWQSLDECGADPALVQLARICLAPNAGDRPADATAVAQSVNAYLVGVQDKLRQTEIARAQEQAQAAHERRARRLTAALAVAVLLLIGAGIGGAWWVSLSRQQHRETTDRSIRQALADARVLQAQRQPAAALTTLKQTQHLLAEADPTIAQIALQLRLDLEQQVKDQRMQEALEQVQLSKTTVKNNAFDASFALEGYTEAFAAYGLAVADAPLEDVIAQVRRSRLCELLCASLDDWAFLKKQNHAPRAEWERLWHIATAADPDPWRNRLRQALQQPKLDAPLLKELAEQTEVSHALISLHLMELALSTSGEKRGLRELWRKAYARQPGDFWVNNYLGLCLLQQGGAHLPEALRHFTAALALQPENAGAHVNVGCVLDQLGRHAEAETAFTRAVALAPTYARAHTNLGLMRMRYFDYAGAIPHYERAAKLQPNLAEAHAFLGVALTRTGKKTEGLAAARRAVALAPRDARCVLHLGYVLDDQGQSSEALTCYLRAVELDGDLCESNLQLGAAYLQRDQVPKALPWLLHALRLEPENPFVLFHLGQAYERSERFQEALPLLTKALTRKPDLATARFRRGMVLMRLGRLAEALPDMEQGHALGHNKPYWNIPSAERINDCRRFMELEKRFDAVKKGTDRPKDANECLDFARFCWLCRNEFVASVRFYQDALAMKPPPAPSDIATYRRTAAAAAARAGCGLGVDASALSVTARVELRQQALQWLRYDLQAKKNGLIRTDANSRRRTHDYFHAWKTAPELACVREPEQLSKLPQGEQAEWRRLWKEVDELVRGLSSDNRTASA